MRLWVLSVGVFLFFGGGALAQESQPLGDSVVPPGAILALGLSGDPVSMEHMGLLARIQPRFGFAESRLVPTVPYKPKLFPGETAKRLPNAQELADMREAQVAAVRRFDQVLKPNSIAFQNFRSSENGETASWDHGGRTFQLRFEDYDLRTNNVSNTLQTLRYLGEEAGGDPNQVYWVSGSDSFLTTPEWMSNWTDLFETANWVVVARPGVEVGKGGLNFDEADPLRGKFVDEFLANYTYRFDAEHSVHIYQHKTPGHPSIYILAQPVLAVSSSEIRTSFAERSDHDFAQTNVQPAVFEVLFRRGLYTETFTRRNYERYFRSLFEEIEASTTVSDKDQADFQKLSKELVEYAVASLALHERQPWYKAMVVSAVEAVATTVREMRETGSLRLLMKKSTEVATKLGAPQFAMIYLAGEVIERFLAPPLAMWMVGGAEGLLLVPFIHVEYLLFPAFGVYKYLQIRAERSALAGDPKTYALLSDFRHRLLRGDPHVLLSVNEMNGLLGLAGKPLRLNLIRSRMPRWVPLFIRQWDYRRVVWHDLNVSTNELRAVVGNRGLVNELRESAEENPAVFANLLGTAALSEPKARLRLQLLTLQRYFSRVSLGELRPELLGAFTPAEQDIISILKTRGERFRQSLPSRDVAELRELTGLAFAGVRTLQSAPELVHDPEFWTTFLDFWITRYPGKRADLQANESRARLAVMLPVFLETFARIRGIPDQFTVRYGDATLGEWVGTHFREHEGLREASLKSPSEQLSYARLRTAFAQYLEENADVFAAVRGAATENRVLPTRARGEDIRSDNPVWEMEQLSARMGQEFRDLEQAFEQATKRLAQFKPDARAENVFRDAAGLVRGRMAAAQRGLLQLEFDLLRARFPFDTGSSAATVRSETPKSLHFLVRQEKIQEELKSHVEDLRALNHMMLGSVHVKVRDLGEVRQVVGTRLKLTDGERARLGASVWRKLWGSCQEIILNRPKADRAGIGR